MEKSFPEVNTRNPAEVRHGVEEIYRAMFQAASSHVIAQSFAWTEEAFAGRYGEYQPIDAKYHDLEHTLQGTLCLARLLQGYHRAKSEPLLTQRAFELAMQAILLHDAGYLKKSEDINGTGAKYTLVHVSRSAEFAERMLREKGFRAREITAVQNMIRCTGINADLAKIPFQTQLEKILGLALATADLLGQMAAEDYVEKLETLYLEFEESNSYNHRANGPGFFSSATDLRKKTPMFWEKYVLPKINGDFLGLYRFLDCPNGGNQYLNKIRSNIAHLDQELGASRSL